MIQVPKKFLQSVEEYKNLCLPDLIFEMSDALIKIKIFNYLNYHLKCRLLQRSLLT